MPQILKTEIKEKILQNALDIFLEKGYKSTSMKEIAQSSGIAVGNIYNYFKDKEALYDTIASPVFNDINEIFTGTIQRPVRLNVDEKSRKFINIYKSSKKVFVMVIENSSDTKFETLKKTIIDNFASVIIRTKNQLTRKTTTDREKVFIKAFTGAYINGIISILEQKIDEETKLEILYDFISLMKKSLISKFGFTRKDLK